MSGDALSKAGTTHLKGTKADFNMNCYFEQSVAFKAHRRVTVEEVFGWLANNVKEEWSFDVWLDSGYNPKHYFSFTNASDALLFKLTFVGA